MSQQDNRYFTTQNNMHIDTFKILNFFHFKSYDEIPETLGDFMYDGELLEMDGEIVLIIMADLTRFRLRPGDYDNFFEFIKVNGSLEKIDNWRRTFAVKDIVKKLDKAKAIRLKDKVIREKEQMKEQKLKLKQHQVDKKKKNKD